MARMPVESRGLIEVKGKGSLPTWFLVGGPGGQEATAAAPRRGDRRDRRPASPAAGPALDADRP